MHVESYHHDLVKNYRKVHAKFFPEKPKPQKAKPGNNAVPISWFGVVDVLNWRLDFPTVTHHEPELAVKPVYPTLEQIIAVVNPNYSFSRAELIGPLRGVGIAMYRHIICYLALRYTMLSSTALGRLLKKDHTTILYGRNRIANLRKMDPEIEAEVQGYERTLLHA